MRSKKAFKNTLSSIVFQLVNIVCGLILPRMILVYFGSKYNGITSSISQFLSCASLLVAGVGGVTKASLYKPLADEDVDQISGVVNATQKFMRRVAVILILGICVFAALYPWFVRNDFDWIFSFTLVMILGISTFLQYYFAATYQLLLKADQRQYIVSFAQIVSTVVNTILAIILLKLGFGIHMVKLGSALAFSLNPLILNIYVYKHYKLRKDVQADDAPLKQRWDAFWQAVAVFVHNNTDVIVLTIFADIREVSVYTVYNYVIFNIKYLVNNFIHGFGAAFGNMLAKGEMELAKKNLKVYELIIFGLTSIIYTTAGIMIVPFALLYTKGVNDVNYARPMFAVIATIAGAFSCFRIPYQTIVEAAGHYKQTRNGAILEAVLNIVISLIAVWKFGLVGVAFGTLAATVFRSFQYALYLSKNIIQRSIWTFIGHIVIAFAIAGITVFISLMWLNWDVANYFEWAVKACIVTLIAAIFTVLFGILFYREDVKYFVAKIKGMLKKKKA